MNLDLSLEAWLRVGVGVSMLALAGWLLILNFRSKLHLTFATFLVLQSVLYLRHLFNLTPGVDPGEWIGPLVLLAVPFVVPLFLINFQACHCIMHAHGGFETEKRIVQFFLTSLVLMAALYVWDSGLYAPNLDLAYVSDPTSRVGPLFAIQGLDLLSFGLLALLFAREYPHSSTPGHRTSYLVVALAFALPAAFGGLLALFEDILLADNLLARGWPRHLSTFWKILGALVVARLLWELRRRAHSARDPMVDQEASAFHRAAIAAFVTALAAALVGLLSPAHGPAVAAAFALVWGVALPLLVAYAILKHRFFDLDRRVRKTVKGGTVAAAFVAVFFGISEGAQTVFQSRWGPALGLAASSLLVFALAPLMRWADRFADKAIPGTQNPGDLPEMERLIFYREQVHIAWGDGSLNPKERLLLNNLRQRLRITAEDAMRIETEALSEARREVQPPGVPA